MDKKKFVKEWLPSVIIVVVTIIIKVAILDVVTVKGISMEPTLVDKNKLIIEKVSTYRKDFNRGDVVIVKNPQNEDFLVKRLVALEGETIECINNTIYINDKKLNEEYLKKDVYTSDIPKTQVPKDYIYVLGDNRPRSKDSRELGAIKYKSIIGKVMYIK